MMIYCGIEEDCKVLKDFRKKVLEMKLQNRKSKFQIDGLKKIIKNLILKIKKLKSEIKTLKDECKNWENYDNATYWQMQEQSKQAQEKLKEVQEYCKTHLFCAGIKHILNDEKKV